MKISFVGGNTPVMCLGTYVAAAIQEMGCPFLKSEPFYSEETDKLYLFASSWDEEDIGAKRIFEKAGGLTDANKVEGYDFYMVPAFSDHPEWAEWLYYIDGHYYFVSF